MTLGPYAAYPLLSKTTWVGSATQQWPAHQDERVSAFLPIIAKSHMPMIKRWMARVGTPVMMFHKEILRV